MSTIYDMFEMTDEMQVILTSLKNTRQWMVFLSGEVGPRVHEQSVRQLDELDETIKLVEARLERMLPPKRG